MFSLACDCPRRGGGVPGSLLGCGYVGEMSILWEVGTHPHATSAGQQNMYGWQAGGTHPIRMHSRFICCDSGVDYLHGARGCHLPERRR